MSILYTIGHSTRGIEEVISLLEEFGIELLVDVRRFPVSRRHPQFRKERLAGSLSGARIRYQHEPGLGGHRTAQRGSANTAWREDAFRGYADHMGTDEFRDALGRVMGLGGATPLVVMCAEADPARCHRRLLADALVARGAEVRHILGTGRFQAHAMNPAGRIRHDGVLVYDVGRQLSLDAEPE